MNKPVRSKGRRAEHMLAFGASVREVAAHLGLSISFVYRIKWMGSYDAVRKNARVYQQAWARRNGIQRRGSGWNGKQNEYDPNEIIAAVDSGLSYSEVARRFELKSRNVVAGVVSRRPEAQA